jgi:hypothetical protein
MIAAGRVVRWLEEGNAVDELQAFHHPEDLIGAADAASPPWFAVKNAPDSLRVRVVRKSGVAYLMLFNEAPDPIEITLPTPHRWEPVGCTLAIHDKGSMKVMEIAGGTLLCFQRR